MFNRSFYKRLVIGVDPALTCHETSDETGIIVAGLGQDGYGYVLDDISGRYSPYQWSQKVTEAYRLYQADQVVVETNAGGDMVGHTLRTLNPHIRIKDVRAILSKTARALPIASLYKRHLIYHERPFEILEDQMCSYTLTGTKKSPDRVDALVWALSDLMLGPFRPPPTIWYV